MEVLCGFNAAKIPSAANRQHYCTLYHPTGLIWVIPPEDHHPRAYPESTTSSTTVHESGPLPLHRSRFHTQSRNSTAAFWALIVSTTSSHSMVYSKRSNLMTPSTCFGYRIERWITNLPQAHRAGSMDKRDDFNGGTT